ncbi:MAG TPA: hypothetical protein VKF15_00435 [Nitrososphaerales archaeon]|nr:hypothetical protein [Nitrososphaerales archaeon]
MSRAVAAMLVLVLALSAVPGLATAQSATNWVALTSVTDLTGNASLQPSQPLLAGHAYNVTMKVTVPFNQSGSHFYPSLDSALLSHGAQFWYVKTPQYPGYNASSFNPGNRTLQFDLVAGTVVLSGIFEVPLSLTLITAGNFTRHQTVNNFTIATVTVTRGSRVGLLSATVEDQTIQTYLSTYQQKSTLISSGAINSAYSTVVNSVLAQAQALYVAGLPAQGTSVLDTIDPASFPVPPSTTTSTTLLAGVVVAIIVIILLAVIVLRGRGKRGFSEGIVSEVQKELALLEVTAAKYDKALADRLQALRNRLGEAD